jgi:hypothetical protein
MKILKKGGSREKGGGGNEIHVPCACEVWLKSVFFVFLIKILYLEVVRGEHQLMQSKLWVVFYA